MQAADLVFLSNGRFLVKGSHRYQEQGQYAVSVKATGACGNSVGPQKTSSVTVSPMPSGIPGTPPNAQSSPSPPSNVTVSLDGVSGFTSFAGVGFERNLTAYLYGTLNSQADNTLDDFHAQINWGDSDQWIAAELVAVGNGRFQIKGSHRYAQQKTSYPVVVYVNGPDGTSTAENTTAVTVSPMPSGIPGKPANSAGNMGDASDVTVSLSGVSGFTAPAAVEFAGELVAYFYGTLNGQPDKNVGDYQAQINWGDSGQWDYAQLLAASGTPRAYGSHVYWTQGTYPVVVYLNGPDGTSVAERTTSVTVGPPTPLPSPNAGKNLGGSCLDSNGPGLCFKGQYSGNPINNTTGNKYQIEQDYAGAGAFALNFIRHYNSQASGAGSLGANWSHSYSAQLTQTSATRVAVTRADRKAFSFNLTSGIWTPDADVNAKLELLKDSQGKTTGWRYTAGDDSVETYSAGGKPLSIASRAGLLTQTLSYDAQGRLSTVSDPFGRNLTLAYDGKDRVASMTDPAGEVYTYAYDSHNNLVSVTYPDAKTRAYVYENASFPNALTGIIDENGQRFATYGYDASGLAIRSEHAGGADKVTLSFDKANNATHVTDALGTTRTYSYGPRQGVWRMLKASQPCAGCVGDAAEQAFDANGNATSRTDFSGNTTCYAYDLTRNLETIRIEGFAPGLACPPDLANYNPAQGSLQRKIATAWHPRYRLPTQIDEAGRSARYTYDAQGNLLKETLTADGKSRVWTYTYNNLGQVLSVDGPRTDIKDLSTFSYDAQGNLASITNALGQTTHITAYDAHGRPLSLEDPNTLTAKLAYDLRGRLVSRSVDAELTRYAYDGAGDLLKVTQPDASFLSFSYDPAHRLTALHDALGNRIAYTLNALGDLTTEKIYDPKGSLTETRSRIYNSLDRLIQSLGAATQKTAYAYDSNGNLARITNPLGQVSSAGYDALNRLSKTLDASQGVARYGYDAHDRLTQVTDPKGFATTYSYDGFDNLLKIQSPDTRSTTNTYDAAGNLKTSTDARGKLTAYAYDALNRITSATFADNSKTTYAYDQGANGIGHLTRLADASGSTAWAYDPLGRIVQKQQQIGAATLTTRYRYDAQGRLATLSYPSGKQIAYGYDAQGHVKSISADGQPLLGAIAYQPFSAAKSWTFGNGKPYSSRFDLDGRIAQFPLANDNRSVSYDAASRITALTDSGLQQGFSYDALSRLTDLTAGAASQSYTYDRDSNRLSLDSTAGNTAYSYAANANRLDASSGLSTKTYNYDAAGNIIADGARSFLYDARGRLVKATQGASSVAYAINGLGQRVAKSGTSVPTGVRLFVYGESGQLLGEYDANGNAVQETVWLNGQPAAVLTAAGRFYVYADQIGTPRRITNQAGATVWSWNSDPFGNGQPASSAGFAYNLRFPGQYFDAETGLHYNYFRDYDPSTGRYLQGDPIGLQGGSFNLYSYTTANPISLADFYGANPLDYVGSDPYSGHTNIPGRSTPADEALKMINKILWQNQADIERNGRLTSHFRKLVDLNNALKNTLTQVPNNLRQALLKVTQNLYNSCDPALLQQENNNIKALQQSGKNVPMLPTRLNGGFGPIPLVTPKDIEDLINGKQYAPGSLIVPTPWGFLIKEPTPAEA